MQPQSENRLVLVVRNTRLDDLIARFNTEDQARFYIEHLGADFADYQDEQRTYRAAVRQTETCLARLGRLQVVNRVFLPNFIFGERDTVVVLGQDGLVANVLKYLDHQIVLGVNPDPRRWDGALLPYAVADLADAVPAVFAGRRPIREVTMAQASLNTGEVLYGVNDLFIGPRSHTSARYWIDQSGRREQQSSSGVIVSTGLGSTGWFRSVLAGAAGIATSLLERPLRLDAMDGFAWDAGYLYFSVREPWPSRQSQADITFGRIDRGTPLTLESQMAEHGVIFSDGMETDYIAFNAGTRATITPAAKRGHLAA